MKLLTRMLPVLLLLGLLSACSAGLTSQTAVTKLYYKNERVFLAAAASGDYTEVQHIPGVQDVWISKDYVEITCGGSGMGSNTHYYGIFFSPADDPAAIDLAGPAAELFPDGAGYRYVQQGGDNVYYAEPLGNHFFYFEAHF